MGDCRASGSRPEGPAPDVPFVPNPNEPLPGPDDVRRAFTRAFAAGDVWFAVLLGLHDAEPPAGTDLAALVLRLLHHNHQVWHYEDLGRTHVDEQVLAGWHGAMRHNKHRNECINAIDALFLARQSPSAPLHSESLGALADRITILWLKHKNYLDRDRAVAEAVRRQFAELVDHAASLAQKLAAGEVRVQVVPRLKLYHSAPPAPVLSAR